MQRGTEAVAIRWTPTGQYATVEYGLPAGHYTLNWEGRNDRNTKHKTFWVTCDNPAGPIGGGGIG